MVNFCAKCETAGCLCPTRGQVCYALGLWIIPTICRVMQLVHMVACALAVQQCLLLADVETGPLMPPISTLHTTAACVTGPHQPADSGGGARAVCTDRSDPFPLSNATTCDAVAQSACTDPHHGTLTRLWCPLACGVCGAGGAPPPCHDQSTPFPDAEAVTCHMLSHTVGTAVCDAESAEGELARLWCPSTCGVCATARCIPRP